MRTKKAIITTALAVPMLALGGGIAYATTSAGSPPPATRTAVTTTVQTTSHHPAGQASRDGHRYDHRCDWRGHGHQQPATQPQATRHPVTHTSDNRHGYGNHNGYGYQGNWGYGQYRGSSGWGNGSGCCGGWH